MSQSNSKFSFSDDSGPEEPVDVPSKAPSKADSPKKEEAPPQAPPETPQPDVGAKSSSVQSSPAAAVAPVDPAGPPPPAAAAGGGVEGVDFIVRDGRRMYRARRTPPSRSVRRGGKSKKKSKTRSRHGRKSKKRRDRDRRRSRRRRRRRDEDEDESEGEGEEGEEDNASPAEDEGEEGEEGEEDEDEPLAPGRSGSSDDAMESTDEEDDNPERWDTGPYGPNGNYVRTNMRQDRRRRVAEMQKRRIRRIYVWKELLDVIPDHDSKVEDDKEEIVYGRQQRMTLLDLQRRSMEAERGIIAHRMKRQVEFRNSLLLKLKTLKKKDQQQQEQEEEEGEVIIIQKETEKEKKEVVDLLTPFQHLARVSREVFGSLTWHKLGIRASLSGRPSPPHAKLLAHLGSEYIFRSKTKVRKLTRTWRIPIPSRLTKLVIPETNASFELVYQSNSNDQKHKKAYLEVEIESVETDFYRLVRESLKQHHKTRGSNTVREILGLPEQDSDSDSEDEKVPEPEDNKRRDPRVFVQGLRSGKVTGKKAATLFFMVVAPRTLSRGFSSGGYYYRQPRKHHVQSSPNPFWMIRFKVPSPPFMSVRRSNKTVIHTTANLSTYYGGRRGRATRSKVDLGEFGADMLKSCHFDELARDESRLEFKETVEYFPVTLRPNTLMADFSKHHKRSSFIMRRPWENRFRRTPEEDSGNWRPQVIEGDGEDLEDDAQAEESPSLLSLFPETENSASGSGTLSHIFSFVPLGDVLGSLSLVCKVFARASNHCILSRDLSPRDYRVLFVSYRESDPGPSLTMDSRGDYMGFGYGPQVVMDRSGLDVTLGGPLSEKLFQKVVLNNPHFDFSVRTPSFVSKLMPRFVQLQGGSEWGDGDLEERRRRRRQGAGGGFDDYTYDDFFLTEHYFRNQFDDPAAGAAPWAMGYYGRRAFRSAPRKHTLSQVQLVYPLPMYFLLRGFRDRKLLLRLIAEADSLSAWAEFVIAKCPRDVVIVKAVVARLRKEKKGVPHCMLSHLASSGTVETLCVLMDILSGKSLRKNGPYSDLLRTAAMSNNLPVLMHLWVNRPKSITRIPKRVVKAGMLHADVTRFIRDICNFQIDHRFGLELARALCSHDVLGEVSAKSALVVLTHPDVDLAELPLSHLPQPILRGLLVSADIPSSVRLLVAMALEESDADSILAQLASMESESIHASIGSRCVSLAALRPGFLRVLTAFLTDKKLRFPVTDKCIENLGQGGVDEEGCSWEMWRQGRNVGAAAADSAGYAFCGLMPAVVALQPTHYPSVLRDEVAMNILLERTKVLRFASFRVFHACAGSLPVELLEAILRRTNGGDDQVICKSILTLVSREAFALAEDVYARFKKDIPDGMVAVGPRRPPRRNHPMGWGGGMMHPPTEFDPLEPLSVAHLIHRTLRMTPPQFEKAYGLLSALIGDLPTGIKDVTSLATTPQGIFGKMILALFEFSEPKLVDEFLRHFVDPLALFRIHDSTGRPEDAAQYIVAAFSCYRGGAMSARYGGFGDLKKKKNRVDRALMMKHLLKIGVRPDSTDYSKFFHRILVDCSFDSSHIEVMLRAPFFKFEGSMSCSLVARSLSLAMGARLNSMGWGAPPMYGGDAEAEILGGYGTGMMPESNVDEKSERSLDRAMCRILDILLRNPDFHGPSRCQLFKNAVSPGVFMRLLRDVKTRERIQASDLSELLQSCLRLGVDQIVMKLVTLMDKASLDCSAINPRKLFTSLIRPSGTLKLLKFVLTKLVFLKRIGGVPRDLIHRLKLHPSGQTAWTAVRLGVAASLMEAANRKVSLVSNEPPPSARRRRRGTFRSHKTRAPVLSLIQESDLTEVNDDEDEDRIGKVEARLGKIEDRLLGIETLLKGLAGVLAPQLLVVEKKKTEAVPETEGSPPTTPLRLATPVETSDVVGGTPTVSRDDASGGDSPSPGSDRSDVGSPAPETSESALPHVPEEVLVVDFDAVGSPEDATTQDS